MARPMRRKTLGRMVTTSRHCRHDEDGLIEPAQDLVLTVDTAPVVRVRATNTTGSAATLYGWIDVNRDGVFDNATERTSVAVPSGDHQRHVHADVPDDPGQHHSGGDLCAVPA